MADNITVASGSYSADIATDDISSVHFQRVKVAVGAANAHDGDLDFGQAAMASSLPVVLASDQAGPPAASTTWDHGSNRDIDATAEQITTASVPALHGVWVKADPANGAGIVYLGNSDVTAGTTDATDGWPLAAGQEAFVRVNNANKVYGIGSTTNLIVYWRVE